MASLISTSASKKLRRLFFRHAALGLAFVAALVMAVSGVTSAIEQTGVTIRSNLFGKSASSDFVVVEMDSKSLREIGRWPWSRTIHAELVEKLSKANAAQIAFDVDFSSKSNPDADTKFANAIAASNSNIILATFKQKAATGTDKFIENFPREEFAKNAMLASVNVIPNELGQISNYGYAEETGGQIRPSLASLLTGASGRLGEKFEIDQAINPKTIPRISVVDVINDRVSASQIAGKNMIIGATAIELGDRYATPAHNVIPGVVIHSLAAETIKSGKNVGTVNGIIPFTILFLFLAVLSHFWGRRSSSLKVRMAIVAIAAGITGMQLALYEMGVAFVEIGLTLGLLFSYFVANMIVGTIQMLHRERTTDAQSGLPNSQLLLRHLQSQPRARIAVAQISNFAEIKAVCSNAELNSLMQALADRLSMLSETAKTYRTATDQLAWIVGEQYAENRDDHFDTAAAIMLAGFAAGAKQLKLNVHCGYVEGRADAGIELMSKASIAAHNAAQHGYRWMAFSDNINKIVEEKIIILSDIDAALANGDIWVAYQPKLNIESAIVDSAEALVRWEHPKLGNISPAYFIPLLEDEGRMADITLHVMQQSLNDIARWNDMGKIFNCSVNVSAILLRDDVFVRKCLALISESRVENHQLTIEVTETSVLEGMDIAKETLKTIHGMGIRISIDDYGTGQSTLTYLRDFSADEIKIDQSFVKFITKNETDRMMVRSTVNLAHDLKLKVVAEGIEDAETLQLLSELGCDVAQGWHIGKPVNFDEFAKCWIKEEQRAYG